MSYRFDQDESVQAGVRRIAGEQIDKAIGEIDDDQLDAHETVHQVRKRCKKVRALARLVRPAFDDYREENERFRDAARTLSHIRDLTATIETFDDLVDAFADQINVPHLGEIRTAMVHARDERIADEADLDERIRAFRRVMVEGRQRAERWTIDAEEFGAVAGGLRKTYGRARDRLAEAFDEPTTERLHEFRKRAKYHWYHLRLLRDVWAPVVKKRRNEADALADLLGDDHDLAMLGRRLLDETQAQRAEPRDAQALLGLIDRRRAELRERARPIAERLFVEKPGRLIDRYAAYWSAWRETADAPAALSEPGIVAGA